MIRIVKRLPIVAVALAIMAASINMFLAPHNIAAGGVSGIGVLLEHAVGIDRALVVLVLNILMLVLAFFFLGKTSFIKSVFGSIMLPIALAIVPERMVVQDRFMSVIAGSVIFAFAVSVLYRIEASSGGTTIPPLILQKKKGINTSLGLLVTDMVVVVFNIFVFGFESFLFAVFSLIITSMVMTYLETGIRRNKAVLISSHEKLEEIQAVLSREIKTNLTVFETTDGHSGNTSPTLMAMLDDKDYPTLIRLVDEQDKQAIVVSYNVANVHGKNAFVMVD